MDLGNGSEADHRHQLRTPSHSSGAVPRPLLVCSSTTLFLQASSVRNGGVGDTTGASAASAVPELLKADGFVLADVQARLANVVGIVDKIVISPTKCFLVEQFKAEAAAVECAEGAACCGTPEKPSAAEERPLPVVGNKATPTSEEDDE